MTALRAFLHAWGGIEEAKVVGALGFAAHRLATGAPVGADAAVAAGATSLGVLFFALSYLRRDAAGRWERVVLELEASEPAPIDSPALAASPADAEAARDDEHADAATDDFAPGGYAAIVERAVQRLAKTPLVSLTLSQSFRRSIDSTSVAAAFERLRAVNPAPATFFFNTGAGERVFGASPDLQLRVSAGQVEAFPVCGTVARGHGAVGEADSFRRLIDEDVDAASLAVCSDALRCDLAPLCEPGSLRLVDRRRPMALATVVHTVDRLSGRLREGVDAWDAIVATAAPVMATGTPRALALQAIGELEAGPRGWYGGLLVQVAADGGALVGTLLRAGVVRNGVAEVRTGGDLLADSEPAREEHESRVKAVSLWRALGLAVAGDLQAELANPGRGATANAIGTDRDTVALCDAGDPFAAAMRDALLGLGTRLDPRAATRVLVGSDEARCVEAAQRAGGLVAVGDAAAHVLRRAGFAVRAIRPEQGRIVRCQPVPGAAWQPGRAFFAARYATLDVDWDANPEPAERAAWQSWSCDERGAPLIVANAARRVVCMLIRPESLMSDECARDALRAAIAFAAGRT